MLGYVGLVYFKKYFVLLAQDSCKTFNWVADGPGFDDTIYDVMYKNYLAQLNVEGVGAVGAAPDGVSIYCGVSFIQKELSSKLYPQNAMERGAIHEHYWK